MKLNDYLQIQFLSIVIVGDFNPTILQPSWLANKKLIREQEAETAKIELIHPEMVRFDLDWVFIQATKDRLELRTSKDPYFSPVVDLAYGLIKLLSESRINALGINHVFHYALPNEDVYYEFGNKLAPLNNWEDFLNSPRLFHLEILEEKRSDGKEGHYRVAVQPSDQKLNTKFAIMININDHYNLIIDAKNRQPAHSILKENYGNSVIRASAVVEKIWEKIS